MNQPGRFRVHACSGCQVHGSAVQRFNGWKRRRSIFLPLQLLNREPFNPEPAWLQGSCSERRCNSRGAADTNRPAPPSVWWTWRRINFRSRTHGGFRPEEDSRSRGSPELCRRAGAFCWTAECRRIDRGGLERASVRRVQRVKFDSLRFPPENYGVDCLIEAVKVEEGISS